MRHTPSKEEALRRERDAVRLDLEKARLARTSSNDALPGRLSRGMSYTEWHSYRPDAPSAEWDQIVEVAEKRFYDLILEVLENLLKFYDYQCERGHTQITGLIAKLRETQSRQERIDYFRQEGFNSKCRFYCQSNS